MVRASRFGKLHRTVASLLVTTVDTQALLGLVLYGVFSPLTRAAMNNWGAAMKDPSSRFWAVEHIASMLAALVLIHIGHVRIKRASKDGLKHRRAVLFFGLAIGLMLMATPWPCSVHSRPWIRGL